MITERNKGALILRTEYQGENDTVELNSWRGELEEELEVVASDDY